VGCRRSSRLLPNHIPTLEEVSINEHAPHQKPTGEAAGHFSNGRNQKREQKKPKPKSQLETVNLFQTSVWTLL